MCLSLIVASYRGSLLDRVVTAGAIAGISVSSLIYILVGQWLLADQWKLFPIWGYEYGPGAVYFVALPIIIWIVLSVGTDVRYFRTVVLEEINQTTFVQRGLKVYRKGAFSSYMYSEIARFLSLPE